MELRDKNGLTEAEFLAAYRPGDYPRPSVTVDILLFLKPKEGLPKLLLVRRGGHPCLGMWALPGGFVNPDENTEAAVLRELEEETGYRAEHIELMGEFIPTGAYLEERIWMYFAWGLSFAGQHPDADEFLHVTKMDMEELVEQIMNGTIIDGKTIAMGLKLQRMLENSSAAKRKAATD